MKQVLSSAALNTDAGSDLYVHMLVHIVWQHCACNIQINNHTDMTRLYLVRIPYPISEVLAVGPSSKS